MLKTAQFLLRNLENYVRNEKAKLTEPESELLTTGIEGENDFLSIAFGTWHLLHTPSKYYPDSTERLCELINQQIKHYDAKIRDYLESKKLEETSQYYSKNKNKTSNKTNNAIIECKLSSVLYLFKLEI